MSIEILPDRDIQLSDSKTFEITGLLYSIYQSATTPKHTERLKVLLGKQFRSESISGHPQLTEQVIQHIQRAIRLGNRFSRLKEERDQLLEYLDESIPPVIVMDESGNLLGSNKQASALLHSTTLFTSQHSLLKDDAANWLDILLDRCKRNGYAHTAVTDDNDRQWSTYCYSLVSQQHFALICLDTTMALEKVLVSFVNNFHLTQKEVEVIKLLLHETTPQIIATQLSISRATLRQHIKNILKKTHTRSQHELLANILEKQIVNESATHHNRSLKTQLNCVDRTRILQMPNGKLLSYAEFGAPDGIPVLYNHSLISSRYELAMYHDWLSKHGIRLICPDRPGYGHSTFWDVKSFSEYNDGINFLLDHLRLDRITFLACSAGCAHAMSFAAHFPERVLQLYLTGIVPEQQFVQFSNHGTTARQAFAHAKRIAPKLFRPAIDLFFHGQTVESMLENLDVENLLLRHSQLDIDYIKQVTNLPFFKAAMIESLRQGSQAWALESSLILGPWGIDYTKFATPVRFWHGDEDVLTSPSAVEVLAKSLKNASLEIVSGESHFLIYRQLTTILAELDNKI